MGDWIGGIGSGIGNFIGNIGGGIMDGFNGIFGGGTANTFDPMTLGVSQEEFGALSPVERANMTSQGMGMNNMQNWTGGGSGGMQWIKTLGNLGLGLAQYNRAGDMFDFQKDAWKSDQNAARKTANFNREDQLRSRYSFGDPRDVNEQYDKDKLDYV